MSLQRLPVIVGFGGINSAGRSSGHHAYCRMADGALPEARQERTLASLAALMGREYTPGDALGARELREHTLIRRIESSHFDPDWISWNQRFPTQSNGQPVTFHLRRKDLPAVIPEDWKVQDVSVTEVRVEIMGQQDFLLPTHRVAEVQAAGQLPSGFEPGKLYPSRSHPRGLQMSVFAASDALQSLGIPWERVMETVPVDQVSVYAGSAMGQLDNAGAGGMVKARYLGQKVTSKYCPFSFAEMPADFINAYVLGNLGTTGATLGACASFLYNLRHGIDDIRSGRARVAFIGGAEAPITPEIMEGYSAMGALASDQKLRGLDGIADDQAPNYRRACRPFSDNCGFTIAESAQMVVLFDDALAMELGASVYGAATDVFVNADGFKKSIAGPGVGNYITMAKAVAAARAIVGERGIREGGLVQAHGTGTPQNRVTESHILSETARAFGIDAWPVAALKAYIGHSLGAASGDQLVSTLGIWEHGVIPGIASIDHLADDVYTDHLAYCMEHREIDTDAARYAVINSKGFGGNNASATVLSPVTTRAMLQARYSKSQWQQWEAANESVCAARQQYDDDMIAGRGEVIYRFDHGVLGDADVSLSADSVQVAGKTVSLAMASPWADMQVAD